MCQPPLAPVLFAVMEGVTPLAERREVSRTVVHRIVIEMRGRQDHAGRAERRGAVRSL